MMSKRNHALSDQLRRAIDQSEMSRYAICKAIGLPESSMSRFMARESGLSFSTMDKLGALLELKLVATTQRGPARDRGKQHGT